MMRTFDLRVSLTLAWLTLLLASASPARGVDNAPPESAVKNPTPTAEVVATVARGRGLRNAGDIAGGWAAFDEALAKARATKDVAGEALALNNIASVYRYEAGLRLTTANQNPVADLMDKSADHYEQALRAARAVGNKSDEAYATLYLGVLAAGRGDADKAFKYYFDALETYKALDNRYYVARTLMFMGSTTLYRRQKAEASLKYFEAALPMFRDVKYWHEAQWVIDDMNVAYEQLKAEANGKR